MSDRSEFGAGVIVCLAKFSEHFWCERDRAIYRLDAYIKGEIPYEELTNAEQVNVDVARRSGDTPEMAVSHAIVMWANGASDHFYDLDRDRAPESLRELADLTLDMGHGFSERVWTRADFDRARDLWKQACIDLDRMLGSDPDWGEW